MYVADIFMYNPDMVFENTVSIRILTVEYRKDFLWCYANLAAPYWRFYWNTSGRSHVVIESSEALIRHDINPLQGYLIPPETVFSSESDGTIDHFYIHFTIGHHFDSPPHGLFSVGEKSLLSPQILSIIRHNKYMYELTGTNQTGDAGSNPLVMKAAGVVTYAMTDLPEKILTAVLDDPVIRKVKDRINRNIQKRYSAEELASYAGCGERALRRRFQETMGITPMEYLQGRRIDQACILLHFSNAPIDEIALETGFYDRYHFSRIFKNHRKISPGEYRRIAGPAKRNRSE